MALDALDARKGPISVHKAVELQKRRYKPR
jgi:hypothetical protein